MLFRQDILQCIASGEVDLAFRCWRKPTVKAGGTLKTAVGVLQIESVKHLPDASAVNEAEAKRAGYASLEELQRQLASQPDGILYRISFRVAGADLRLKLREQIDLAAHEWQELERRLHRLDAASKVGPWTDKVLRLIAEHPHVRAQILADQSSWEKEWLKTNIRKLKNLGLTISGDVGYEISPRGRAWLKRQR